MKLIWGNQEGIIDNNVSQWPINIAPVFSFTYDGLFFSEDSGANIKIVGIGRIALSELEIEEIKSYINSLTAANTSTSLQDKQDMAWELIKAERARRTQTGGYKVAVNSVDKWFHSDLFSRCQQTGLVLLGASIPANLQWKTMDGSFVTMTQTLAQQVFGAAAASDVAIFKQAEVHKAAMMQAADPSTYDYSIGWPLIYGE